MTDTDTDTDPDICDTDPAMCVFSGFLIALHELGRLDGEELAVWQAGVEHALREAVPTTAPSISLRRSAPRVCAAVVDA